jgi:DNA-binding transcriptional ArsR family regulator
MPSTFEVLAEPRRRQILDVLRTGECSVNDLIARVPVSQPGMSKHLKVLREAGLVSQGRDAQWRPCRIEPQRLRDVSDWLERYRRMWDERLDRLDRYLTDLQQEHRDDDRTRDDR